MQKENNEGQTAQDERRDHSRELAITGVSVKSTGHYDYQYPGGGFPPPRNHYCNTAEGFNCPDDVLRTGRIAPMQESLSPPGRR